MYIDKTAFIQAISLVDEACGTQRIHRSVEQTLLRRFMDYDLSPTSSKNTHRVFDARDRFRTDVSEIAALLESDGTLYCPDTRRFLDRDSRIARELIESGITWATTTKVKEARQLLRRSA